MSLNFAGQNLCGRSFQGQDLSGANFSRANLQGADFTAATLTDADFSDANLQGANFTQAMLQRSQFMHTKTGLRRIHRIGLSVICLLAAGLAGLGAGLAGSWLSNLLLSDNSLFKFGATITTNFHSPAAGVLALVVLVVAFTAMMSQGLKSAAQIGLVTAIGAGVMTTTISAFKAGVGNSSGEVGAAVGGSAAVAVILAVVPVLLIALSATLLESFITPALMAGVGVIVSVKVGTFSKVADAVLISTGVGGIVFMLLGLYVARCVLTEKNGYGIIKRLAVAIAASRGTRFQAADLTDANFSYATFKYADFRRAIGTRALWHRAKDLDWARVEGTILTNSAVCTLLISGNGVGKSYAGADLTGANLIGAELNHTNLSTADLSHATLQGASLEWANLSQVQAIRADFTHTKMTGVCGLGTWNIDSSTILEEVECRWVYLLEQPKPGTDDRERRPSSGEFSPGEFTSLFRQVIDTIDLIFRNGIDWRAFTQSFQQVQVEHETAQLEIQSIENKGNGIVVVKVRTQSEVNKGSIHSRFMECYQDAIALMHYQSGVLHQHQQEIQSMRDVVNRLVERPALDQVVVLHIGNGSVERGFPVTLQILRDGMPLPSAQCVGELPPNEQIFPCFQYWRSTYRRSLKSTRLEIPSQVTNVSSNEFFRECRDAAIDLAQQMNRWLASEPFRPVERTLHIRLNPNQPIRIILQTDDLQLRQLPWQTWRFLDDYPQAEVALSKLTYHSPTLTAVASPREIKNQVRILAILGDNRGIDLDKDKAILEALEAQVTFLVTPQRQDLSDSLWSQPWDIVYFAGHSRSQTDGSSGKLWLTSTEHLAIADLRHALNQAISHGLRLAIFNSCDGLGLANTLADLQIPQMIVMREPIPDAVAHAFLMNFLTGFSMGTSFCHAMRQAREKLQDFEDQYPCATWLPVMVQNPAEIPSTWQDLKNT
jgi:uncharacterized protein YjbI with pentapeptide repeats